MTTSIKNIILFATIIIGMASCSNEAIEEVLSASSVTERVDIKISGDNELYINEQSKESDSNMDLVSFDNGGNTFGFEVRLDNDQVLKITIQDNNMTNVARQAGSFNIVNVNDMADRSRFVVMDIEDASTEGVKTYSTNHMNNTNAIVDAFSIVDYNMNTKEILCKINNVEMKDSNNNTIKIEGTFKGAINY